MEILQSTPADLQPGLTWSCLATTPCLAVVPALCFGPFHDMEGACFDICQRKIFLSNTPHCKPSFNPAVGFGH